MQKLTITFIKKKIKINNDKRNKLTEFISITESVKFESGVEIKKEIELIADKLEFKSEKLYLWGTSLTHNQYSYFLINTLKASKAARLDVRPESGG